MIFSKKILKTSLENQLDTEETFVIVREAAKDYQQFMSLKRKIEAIELKCKQDVKAVKEEIASRQKNCSHVMQYYPDASGNNGSWTECLICGMEEGYNV